VTAIRFRPELHEALATAAREREVSINWLVNRAVADFLPRLVPVDEIEWTREPSKPPTPTKTYDPLHCSCCGAERGVCVCWGTSITGADGVTRSKHCTPADHGRVAS
jgi:HicB family